MNTPRKPHEKAPSVPNCHNPVATVYITTERAGVREAQFYRNTVLLRAGYKNKLVLFLRDRGCFTKGSACGSSSSEAGPGLKLTVPASGRQALSLCSCHTSLCSRMGSEVSLCPLASSPPMSDSDCLGLRQATYGPDARFGPAFSCIAWESCTFLFYLFKWLKNMGKKRNIFL